MTQHIAVRDDTYNELKKLKIYKEESFTRIINRLIEESREKDKIIENLSKAKDKEFWNKGIIHQT